MKPVTTSNPKAVLEKAGNATQEKHSGVPSKNISDMILIPVKVKTQKVWAFLTSFTSAILYITASAFLYCRYEIGKDDLFETGTIICGIATAGLAGFISFWLTLLVFQKVSMKQLCRWVAVYIHMAITYFVWGTYTTVVCPEIFYNSTLRLLGMTGVLLIVNILCVAQWLQILVEDEHSTHKCYFAVMTERIRGNKTKDGNKGTNNEKGATEARKQNIMV